MVKNILLTSCTSALLTAGYVLYAQYVVPRIEPALPPLSSKQLPPAPKEPTQHGGEGAARLTVAREVARRAFGEDAPEANAPYWWQFADGQGPTTIYFYTKDYKETAGNQIVFRPLSMVIEHMPESGASQMAGAGAGTLADGAGVPPAASITTLRCPEAQLKFEDLDLDRLKAGRPQGGLLKGDVQILHYRNGPDRSEPLRLSTRDVRFLDAAQGAIQGGPRLVTSAPVEFVDGANHGKGDGMLILLATPSSKPAASTELQVSGIRVLQLRQNVRMVFHVDPKSASLGSVAASPDAAAAGRPAGGEAVPLEIRCRGPFQYNLETNTASFRDAVEVLYHVTPESIDRLQCEQLDLRFGRDDGLLSGAAPDAGGGGLVFRKLWARGRPVLLDVPQNQVHVLATAMFHDAEQGTTILSNDDAEVLIVDEDGETRAQRLTLQQDKQGEMKSILAEGAGRMNRRGRRQGRALHARWKERFRIDREDGLYVLRVGGDGVLDIPSEGSLRGDKIAVWLRPEESNGASDPVEESRQSAATKESVAGMQPVKLHAEGAVRVESPQLTGKYDRLEMRFDEATAPGAAPSVASTAPVPVQQDEEASAERMHVDARVLQVRLLREAQKTRVTDVWADGRVHARQQGADDAGESLVLTGDHLRVKDAGPRASMHLTGNPARVQTPKFALAGPVLDLDRAGNRLDVEGRGALKVAVDRDMDGRPIQTPKHLEIRWGRAMQFDGAMAVFRGSVDAQLDATRVLCQLMEVTLEQPISFADPSPADGEAPVQIERIECKSDGERRGSEVQLVKELRENGRLIERQHGTGRWMVFDVSSGDLEVQGPGTFVSVKPGEDPVVGPRVSRESGQTPSSAGRGASDAGLKRIEVHYAHNMTGNLNDRSATFHENVNVIYAPVERMDELVDRFDLPERGLWLRSDTLEVTQQSPRRSVRAGQRPSGQDRRTQGPMILNARGKVQSEFVDQAHYRAHCHRMSYSEAWDRLILEGRPAKVWRQTRPGAARDRFDGGRITLHYDPRTQTQKLKIDDATVIAGSE